MLRKRFVLFISIFLTGVMAIAQDGAIKGKVMDKETGEAIPFANIIAESGGKQFGQTTSDFDGYYTIKPLPPGKYDVKVTFVGYQSTLLPDIVVSPDSSIIVDIKLAASADGLACLEVVAYKTPMINKDKGRSDIRRYPTRSGIRPGGHAPYTSADAYYIQHNTESYDVINENIFKEVLNNPLSTFSVDVDKASYSNIRRFINQNQKPPKDAVRIEEMVNYFDYDYPQPKNDDPFSINFESAECPWNKSHDLVLIGIQGKEIKTEKGMILLL